MARLNVDTNAGPPTEQGRRSGPPPPRRVELDRSRLAFRTGLGGVVGGLPGLAVIGVPVLLHALDVISSDQSQIAFSGIPLLFIGILFGSLAGASGSSCAGSVMLGSVAGLVVGLAAGMMLNVLILSGLADVLWLLIAPVGQLLGAVVAARVCQAR